MPLPAILILAIIAAILKNRAPHSQDPQEVHPCSRS